MKGTLKLFFLAISLLLFFIGCSDENDLTVSIDPELRPFFILFQEEALNRGLIIDLTSVRGVLEDLDDENLAANRILAHCSGEDGMNNIITIDATRWARLDDFSKQYIVFHELGHCALSRDHFDDKNINGDCISLMHSTFEACIDDFTSITRSDYLDELFLTK